MALMRIIIINNNKIIINGSSDTLYIHIVSIFCHSPALVVCIRIYILSSNSLIPCLECQFLPLFFHSILCLSFLPSPNVMSCKLFIFVIMSCMNKAHLPPSPHPHPPTHLCSSEIRNYCFLFRHQEVCSACGGHCVSMATQLSHIFGLSISTTIPKLQSILYFLC